jgi:hypothetical protein
MGETNCRPIVYNSRMNERHKPSIGIWCLVALILYPLSIGPAAWFIVNVMDGQTTTTIEIIYKPVQFVFEIGPSPVRDVIQRYIEVWVG